MLGCCSLELVEEAVTLQHQRLEPSVQVVNYGRGFGELPLVILLLLIFVSDLSLLISVQQRVLVHSCLSL